MQSYHIPVLAEESVNGMNLFPGADVVDATFGGGGHSKLILENIGAGRLFAFDQDQDAAANVIDDPRFYFIRHNFRYIKNFLKFYDVSSVDAIFADLGVSSHDFDVADRGFSFRFDGALDMRMNRNSGLDAAKVVNEYPMERLEAILRMYGEVKNARRLASLIVEKRNQAKINTTTQLRSGLP